jgi:hypothetical protein
MPFKSKSQQRYMHAAASRGDIPQRTVAEFDKATQKKKGGFSGLPEKMAYGGETSEDAIERFMERRRRMAEGGQVQDNRALPDRPRYQPPPDEPLGRTMKRDVPIPVGSLPVYQGEPRKKMARGGAVEPVWDPLDEQDSEQLEEDTESDRHRHEFMLAFAGALAKSRKR